MVRKRAESNVPGEEEGKVCGREQFSPSLSIYRQTGRIERREIELPPCPCPLPVPPSPMQAGACSMHREEGGVQAMQAKTYAHAKAGKVEMMTGNNASSSVFQQSEKACLPARRPGREEGGVGKEEERNQPSPVPVYCLACLPL